KVEASEQGPAALREVEQQDRLGQGDIAGAGRANDTDQLAGRHGQTDVVQNFRAVDAIAERDMLESNVPADRRKRRAARIVDRLRPGIEGVAESLKRKGRRMKKLPGLRQAEHLRTH